MASTRGSGAAVCVLHVVSASPRHSSAALPRPLAPAHGQRAVRAFWPAASASAHSSPPDSYRQLVRNNHGLLVRRRAPAESQPACPRADCSSVRSGRCVSFRYWVLGHCPRSRLAEAICPRPVDRRHLKNRFADRSTRERPSRPGKGPVLWAGSGWPSRFSRRKLIPRPFRVARAATAEKHGASLSTASLTLENAEELPSGTVGSSSAETIASTATATTPTRRHETWTVQVSPGLDKLPSLYKELIKAKLAGLVVLTTMCGYAVAPGARDLATLFYTSVGTGLCVGSANAINQWLEVPYDAQMSRTRNRVLVRNEISPLHAFVFGGVTGTVGVALLATTVNPVTAALGFANILLYTAAYTPMKRASIANTWVGAVVGAIPPIMGWAACTGSMADPGALLLGATLYAWQFPHFNALAYNLRGDYARAGYRMMAVTNPNLNSRVALRYSLLLFPIGWLAPIFGVTTWPFAVDSALVNLAMAIPAWKFWRRQGEKNARQLFFVSLVHLPLLLALMMFHKAPPESGRGNGFTPSSSTAADFAPSAAARDDDPPPEESPAASADGWAGVL
ncbi:MAG: UbiA prenyltransferase family-domain-containing protein [Olpidium bornovanus]|uniref:Protoheme IX farnesyltransferase, mitochondrial n=1 Tax=Olpidium bornovanus TaxID=278681 RepID=A0A8H7ZZB4_9FUNG|nr:MAG: UbiA prenyltransferase family-domain-containing protein [Olpidium bornovanus]